MPILNYTSTVAVSQSLRDISKILQGRVASLSIRYDEEGAASGMALSIRTPHGERSFVLPVRIDEVREVLRKDPAVTRSAMLTRQHAERVAWRIAKDWLAAQCALVDAEMASMDEVMLPYLVTGDGGTLYESYKGHEQAALEGTR